MAKRGRKKARTTPKKRKERVIVDRIGATPESIIKKVILVGRGNDPTLGESPIGVMVARKIITPTDEHHLKDVAKLRKFRHGSPTPSALSEGKSPSLFDSEAKTRSYHEAADALGMAYNAIMEVAAHNHYPSWLLAKIGLMRMTKSDEVRMGEFNTGLLVLANLWGMRIRTT